MWRPISITWFTISHIRLRCYLMTVYFSHGLWAQRVKEKSSEIVWIIHNSQFVWLKTPQYFALRPSDRDTKTLAYPIFCFETKRQRHQDTCSPKDIKIKSITNAYNVVDWNVTSWHLASRANFKSNLIDRTVDTLTDEYSKINNK